MAGRGSGAASDNITRPQLRHGGTKAILGAKVLEKAADMLQNVESMSPQTIAPKARKRVSEARRSVQAAHSSLTSYHNGKLACKHTAIGLNVMPSHIRTPTQ